MERQSKSCACKLDLSALKQGRLGLTTTGAAVKFFHCETHRHTASERKRSVYGVNIQVWNLTHWYVHVR